MFDDYNSAQAYIPEPNSPPRQYECSICSKYFKTKGDKNRHERSVHSGKDREQNIR